MTEAEVYQQLTGIFHDAFGDSNIVLRSATTAADVEGWDSFKQIELIIACEERFGVKFTTRELDHLTSVGDLAGLIIAKTA